MVTAWPDPKLNSSDRTKPVEDDSLVTMVMGLGSISFLLLDDDSLPVWDWQEAVCHQGIDSGKRKQPFL